MSYESIDPSAKTSPCGFRSLLVLLPILALSIGYYQNFRPINVSLAQQSYGKSWTLYKHAIAVGVGSGIIWKEKMQSLEILGEVSTSILGCDGIRHSGSLGSINGESLQLHTVEGAHLDYGTPSVKSWEHDLMNLNGDMTEYNVAMDNRVTMFVKDLLKYQTKMDDLNIPHLRKISGDDNEFGHLLFQNTGFIYELIGPFSTTDKTDYVRWTKDECEVYQRPPLGLDNYLQLFGSDLDKRPMPISFSVALTPEEYDQSAQLSNDLREYTHAEVKIMHAEGCQYKELHWDMAPDVKVKIVSNKKEGKGSSFLRKFNQDVMDLNYAISEDGSGWTHYLDYHIGLENMATSNECKRSMKSYLDKIESRSQPYGGRVGNGNSSHLYIPYPGSMTYEFNFPCSTKVYDDMCACIGSNNNHDYVATTGAGCPKMALG